MIQYSEKEAAEALINVLGESRWTAVIMAKAFLGIRSGENIETMARLIYDSKVRTLGESRNIITSMDDSDSFLQFLEPREETSEARNPLPKMFPATLTEERFRATLEELCQAREGLTYSDNRKSGHTLLDFSLRENDYTLPINVKNAGARFINAKKLVGLEPDDCIPIPTYKAHRAIETDPNLIYAVSVDFELPERSEQISAEFFNSEEQIIWDLTRKYKDKYYKDGEDDFIFSSVDKYWDQLKPIAGDSPFQMITAKKAVQILRYKPERTPGIGVPKWGTGAVGETNVHISISNEMTPWKEMMNAIARDGLENIISGINQTKMELIPDPKY